MEKLIIHYVFKQGGTWKIAYEIKGQWTPKTDSLINLIKINGTKLIINKREK